MKEKYYRVTYILAITISFTLVYSYIFDHRLDSGGDNASYFILGKSIAGGDGYRNIESIDQSFHTHFPPGYPLLLSGIIKTFPSENQIFVAKITNGILLLVSCLLIYLIIVHLSGNDHLSFAVSILCLTNVKLLKFSTIMMSEIPYMAVATACIFLFLKTDFKKESIKNIHFFALLILVVFSIHIRSLGISLAAAIGLYLLLNKHWKYALIWIIGGMLLMLPWQLRNRAIGAPSSYVGQFLSKNPYNHDLGSMSWNDWVSRISTNTGRYVAREIPNGLFPFESLDYTAEIRAFELIVGTILIGLIVLGIWRFKPFRLFFILYIGCTLIILLNWPQVWVGTRFIFHLIPIFLFYIFYAASSILTEYVLKEDQRTKFIPVVIVLVIVAFYWPSIRHLNRFAKSDWPPHYNQFIETAKWAKQNLGNEAVISSRKPTFFHMYSNSYVSSYMQTSNHIELIEHLKKNRVTHVVIDRLGYTSTNAFLIPTVKKYPKKFVSINRIGEKGSETILLEFRPELGYEGEVDDQNQPNGFGKYTWEKDRFFEGNWINGKRNGKGILHLPDGRTIQGEWTNDKIEGEAIVTDANGSIHVLYKNNRPVRILNK